MKIVPLQSIFKQDYMFTINIYLKFALIFVCLVGGAAMMAIWGFWYGFPFLLIGIGLLASYIFLGTVQSAAQLMEKMDFEETEKRLKLTLFPKLLYVTNRAFYFIIQGTLALNLKRNDEAEDWFNQAKDLKLPSDSEKGLVLLQLANINANKGKWNQANVYFQEVKKLKITEPQLKEQVQQFERAFKQRGQAKHLRTGGAMRSGGKRRRPKMR
jgi:tetratricopeptide (TPR) repeat protein